MKQPREREERRILNYTHTRERKQRRIFKL
jgi:hypothetical protein